MEKINRFTDQALYYARSEHIEKDYSIREIHLDEMVHGAIADNKYLLRQNHVAITVDEMENGVYTDDKWVRFILNQLISNAVTTILLPEHSSSTCLIRYPAWTITSISYIFVRSM